MVREQLERDREQDRRQLGRAGRDADDLVEQRLTGLDRRVVGGGAAVLDDADHGAAAGADLVDGRDVLLDQVVVRHQHDAREVGRDQRQRPVLELAGRVRLGVDVGDLLELLRALERDRVAAVAPDEEQRVGRRVLLGDGLDLRLAGDDRLDRVGQRPQALDQVPAPRPGPRSRTRPRCSASSDSAASIDVNALVEATEISGPECR